MEKNFCEYFAFKWNGIDQLVTLCDMNLCLKVQAPYNRLSINHACQALTLLAMRCVLPFPFTSSWFTLLSKQRTIIFFTQSVFLLLFFHLSIISNCEIEYKIQMLCVLCVACTMYVHIYINKCISEVSASVSFVSSTQKPHNLRYRNILNDDCVRCHLSTAHSTAQRRAQSTQSSVHTSE